MNPATVGWLNLKSRPPLYSCRDFAAHCNLDLYALKNKTKSKWGTEGRANQIYIKCGLLGSQTRMITTMKTAERQNLIKSLYFVKKKKRVDRGNAREHGLLLKQYTV